MNRKIIIVLSLAVLLLVAVGLNMTGFVLINPQGGLVDVVRNVIEVDEETKLSYISLAISAKTSVLAIEEKLIQNGDDECFVFDSWLDKEISVFAPGEVSSMWILGNNSEVFSVELIYAIPSSCEIDIENSNVYILEGEDQPTNGEGTGGGSGGGSGGSGGGSGGAGPSSFSTPSLAFEQITQAESEEEYEELKNTAKNLIGLEAHEKIKWGSFSIIILGIVIVIMIFVILILAFFRKPKKMQRRLNPVNSQI